MAVAEVEDSPAVVDMGYARELHMVAAVVGGTALVVVLAVVDIRLVAHAVVDMGYARELHMVAAVVGSIALVVVPAVVDIHLAAHNLEEGQEGHHSLAGVDNPGIAANVPEEGTAGVEAAGILLLICEHKVGKRR